jgi:Group II intron, maturase-specific domain
MEPGWTSVWVKTNERDSRVFDLYEYSARDYQRIWIFRNTQSWRLGGISPSGRWLALNQTRSNFSSELYVWDRDNPNQEPLLLSSPQSTAEVVFLTFSSDSQEVYYSTDQNGEFREAWKLNLHKKTSELVLGGQWDVIGLKFLECGLELHPVKTKIVYCKDDNRKGKHESVKFDFLGYTFRQRQAVNTKRNVLFTTFSPAVNKSALKSMRAEIRRLGFRSNTEMSLEEISNTWNPILRGWQTYYGKFHSSALRPIFFYFNKLLVAWVRRKYKRFKHQKQEQVSFWSKLPEQDLICLSTGNKGS